MSVTVISRLGYEKISKRANVLRPQCFVHSCDPGYDIKRQNSSWVPESLAKV